MVANRNDLEGKILSEVQELPTEALAEIVQFLEFQRYKLERDSKLHNAPSHPVALEGLWAGHDLSEEEIDEVRREMWCGSGEQES